MNNSQSSDVFSGSGNRSYDDPFGAMDTVTYEDLVINTKLILSKNLRSEVLKSTFPELFSSVIDECSTCVTQSLDLVIGIISDTKVNLNQLCNYLNNAVNILQMMCGFLANVIESISMNCCRMKTFPTTIGRIIFSVFSHCKNSESFYGTHLKIVEKQLKDLFRNCHDLQLTYLMVLEKKFIFDLSEYEELCILIEALDINLKIGEIVQTLDVKTMAEQWKAYTMICEKYSDYLLDRHIYEDCTKVLCKMIENNVRTAVEVDQEDKIVLRSLKVASFSIKILLRVCNIFKHATNKNYEHITELLLYIYLNNSAYLESVNKKSSQFVELVNNNVFNPTENLLKDLTLHEKFVNHLLEYQIENVAKDDKLLSYILIIISAMKFTLQGNNIEGVKQRILDCVFKWLPFGHVWLNMGLQFKSTTNSYVTFGIYERLLTNTLAMASTFDPEEINYLERKMYESLLETESYSALFCSNLWELLARWSPRQYLFNQVISLCKIYQKLECNKMFAHSPQEMHVMQTLRKLFKNLNSADKSKVYKQLKISDERNFGLWSVLGIKNSGFDLQRSSEEQIVERLKMKFHQVINSEIQSVEEIDSLIKLIRLTSTCSFLSQDQTLESYIIKTWMMLCPKNKKSHLSSSVLDEGNLWKLELIEALTLLTTSMLPAFRRNCNLVKILHVMSSLIEEGNTEQKLVLINLLLDISKHSYGDENKQFVNSLLMKIFTFLLQDTNSNVKNKVWNELRKHKHITNIHEIISKIIEVNSSIKPLWNNLTKVEIPDSVTFKECLIAAMDRRFSHKCIEKETVIELSDSVPVIERTNSSNFDFADIDTLFEVESDSEPASKRIKLDSNEAEQIIARLEKDVLLLSNVKENVVTSDCKVRIRMLCEQLVNIID